MLPDFEKQFFITLSYHRDFLANLTLSINIFFLKKRNKKK